MNLLNACHVDKCSFTWNVFYYVCLSGAFLVRWQRNTTDGYVKGGRWVIAACYLGGKSSKRMHSNVQPLTCFYDYHDTNLTRYSWSANINLCALSRTFQLFQNIPQPCFEKHYVALGHNLLCFVAYLWQLLKAEKDEVWLWISSACYLHAYLNIFGWL